MPRGITRKATATRLISRYVKYKKFRIYRAERRRRKQQTTRAQRRRPRSFYGQSGSDSGMSVDDLAFSEPDTEPDLDYEADDEEEGGGALDRDELGEDDEGENEGADDVDSFSVDEAEILGESASTLGRKVRITLANMYAHRYQVPQEPLPRPPADLPHVLNVLKTSHPYRFRQQLRVTPYTFDRLVDKMPVEWQVAIVLYRFGRYGNGASLLDVAAWAGIGEGTVVDVTRRVITALLRQELVNEAVRFPTDGEKESAREWVEKHSCRAWRNGFYFVDGTLVPLYERPNWYGESYFDRKCNYSLNIQIISLPNLRIIDFGYGFTGSTHDATAWKETRLPKERASLLRPEEFVWADSAYPISSWVVAPYKKPLRDIRENEVFNNHVSMLRIRSEHAIGFLKGRFQSLKGLRLRIEDEAGHHFATKWVVACIVTHAFAMQCEAEEKTDDNFDDDPFLAEGLSSSSDVDVEHDNRPTGLEGSSTERNSEGKRFREQLKEALFRSKERRRARRQRGT
ncbi:hypothetical protein EWM64_g4525 [Hericium alpestre]|uniref:DDE Tnp4 domain-containing protein n=1 Tax=Hericium alpestre TaxID=135208 RepID=A0A4Y9ZXE9_9AGAM|nr:hypothetical protein EWM64_g4525 [Hericium alpestre]